MKKLVLGAIMTTGLLAAAAPAQASSMPRADFTNRNTLGLGLGNGLSLSVDFPISRQFMLGAGIGAPYFSAGNLDVRGLVKLLDNPRGLDLALIVGAQASGPRFSQFTYFQPLVGVGLAYPFTSQLSGRLNVVVAVFDRSPTPSGIELGYRFTRDLEGTLGWNGRGDVLGLKFSF